MKNNHMPIFFVWNYHQLHQNHELTVQRGDDVTNMTGLNNSGAVCFLPRAHSCRPSLHTVFHSPAPLCGRERARGSGILPGWRHTPRLCPARRHIDAVAARARGKWRAAAGWSTSLIWAFRSRTSGKAAVRSAEPVAPTSQCPARRKRSVTSLCRSRSSCWRWGRYFKLLVARKLREWHLLPPRTSRGRLYWPWPELWAHQRHRKSQSRIRGRYFFACRSIVDSFGINSRRIWNPCRCFRECVSEVFSWITRGAESSQRKQSNPNQII